MWKTSSDKKEVVSHIEIINSEKSSYDEKENAFAWLCDNGLVIEPENEFNMRDYARSICEKSIMHILSLLKKGHPIVAAVSWGKDSTACLVLLIEAMKRCKILGYELPKCYTISSNTELENPALDQYFEGMQNELTKYCAINELPMQYIEVTPPLTSNFFYVTVGRGKLPRYPGMSRDCSLDWKINPIIKAKKKLPDSELEKITIVGTRHNESVERKKRMQERGDQYGEVMTNKNGDSYITPITDWELEDVWALLSFCDDREGRAMYKTFVSNFDECIELYKDANGGECVAAMSDKQLNDSACGARFGCWACVATGDRDRSMQSMIESNPEKYGYLEKIAKLRDWIYSLRYAHNRRTWLGRTYDKEDGYLKLHPDYLDFDTRRDLLRYILTIQAEENEWANEHNSEIVRFNLFKTKQLIAIDFMWSMYRDAPHAFSALHEYHQIMNCGRRYPLPEKIYQPNKASVPKARWLKIPEGSITPDNGITGLYDPYEVAVGKSLRGESSSTFIKDRITGQEKEIVPFDVTPAMTIDDVEAMMMMIRYCDTPMCIETTGRDPIEGAFYYLNKGVIRLGKAQAAGLDEMVQKATYWRRLQRKLNIYDIESWALEQSISDAEYKAIKNKGQIPVEIIDAACVDYESGDQMKLFA